MRTEIEELKRLLDFKGIENELLLSENDNLKAEVESVRQVAQDNKTETEATRIENARLKSEVERLTEDNRQLTKAIEIADGVIKRMGNAAKEGKQS